uniref:Uncharacterized protein n=1 Tax=Anopheles atroparvus TaxID=41427 RepID=A0AAG5DP02_ANOAO
MPCARLRRPPRALQQPLQTLDVLDRHAQRLDLAQLLVHAARRRTRLERLGYLVRDALAQGREPIVDLLHPVAFARVPPLDGRTTALLLRSARVPLAALATTTGAATIHRGRRTHRAEDLLAQQKLNLGSTRSHRHDVGRADVVAQRQFALHRQLLRHGTPGRHQRLVLLQLHALQRVE